MASGHIERDGNNYYIVLEVEGESRKRIRKSVRKELGLPLHQWNLLSAKERKDKARELLSDKLKNLKDGTYIEPTEITVKEYLNHWLKTYCATNLRQTTRESYKSFIDLHIIPVIGHIQLSRLKAEHLDKLYSDKLLSGRADGKKGGLSPRSVRYIHTIMFEALKHAVKKELIARNVAALADPPRQETEEREVWDAEEVQKFLQAISEHRLYPLYILALASGLRRGELLGLRWQDIDLERGIITVRNSVVVTREGPKQQSPKTKKSRRAVKVSPKIIEVLKRHREVQKEELYILSQKQPETMNLDNLVFTSERGTMLHPRNLVRHYENVIEKEELKKITFHDLRHTNATMMARAGVHMKVISARLGHSSIAITDIYAHLVADMQDDAAVIGDALLPVDGWHNPGTEIDLSPESKENGGGENPRLH